MNMTWSGPIRSLCRALHKIPGVVVAASEPGGISGAHVDGTDSLRLLVELGPSFSILVRDDSRRATVTKKRSYYLCDNDEFVLCVL